MLSISDKISCAFSDKRIATSRLDSQVPSQGERKAPAPSPPPPQLAAQPDAPMTNDSQKGGGKKRERSKEEELMRRKKTSSASAVEEDASLVPAKLFHVKLTDVAVFRNPSELFDFVLFR